MYGKSSGSSSGWVFRVVLLGVIAGIGWFFFNNPDAGEPTSSPAQVQPLPSPTVAQSVVAAPATPTPYIVERTSIFIPTAGILAPVIEAPIIGSTWEIAYLGGNAGHLQGTPWFDQPGNTVVVGHVEMADGRPGIFAPIRDLQVGELIVVSRGQQEWRYAVTDVRSVEPDDLSVIAPTTSDQLTLITCEAYNFLQGVYLSRLVVTATRLA